MRDYKGIRPIVGIPLERAISFADQVYPWMMAIAQQWPICVQSYQRVDKGRNIFAEHLLDEPRFTHLVMLDLDHEHPIDIVGKLCESVAEAPDERRAVSALAFRRAQPYDPIAWRWDDEVEEFYSITSWEPGEVLEVDQFSTSACIIAREVFEEMPWPWFKYQYPKRGIYPTEDIWFCTEARRLGIKMHVDTRIRTLHLNVGRVDEAVFRHYVMDQARRQEAANGTRNQSPEVHPARAGDDSRD